MLKNILSLFRLHSLAGSFLLMWPGLVSITLGLESLASLTNYHIIRTYVLFIIGSFIMRSAGCIINDLADYKIDALTERTKERPIASGRISRINALKMLVGLLVIGLIILLQFNGLTIFLGICAMGLVLFYPYTKRFFPIPQLFLGITFNLGAIMGYTAVKGYIGITPLLLYAALIFWTIGYDTIYAVQDIEWDRKNGVNSSAIFFGDSIESWVKICYIMFMVLLLCAGIMQGLNNFYFLLLLGIGYHLYWQINLLKSEGMGGCWKAFDSNKYLGGIMLLVVLIGKI